VSPPVRETIPPIPAWWTSRLADVQRSLDSVRRGQVQTLSVSPGGREVQCVAYGQAEPHLRGAANFNSALGAGRPEAYIDRARRQRPVMLILAGVHGQEVEGVIGALSVIRLLETGRDLRGREQPELLSLLQRLRVVVIPLANPDGRARVPADGFVGVGAEEMHRLGQGTRRDGSNYNWPGCKAVHPMTGDVGFLGGYFDDAGVNLMHDEWPDPMSATTSALCRLTRVEGPDLLLNLHSYEHAPGFLAISYVPMTVKQQVRAFAERCRDAFAAIGLPSHRLPDTDPDGATGVPPALNLTSVFYHCGATLPLTFESPQGLSEGPDMFTYEQILDIHHTLFRVAGERLLGV
jgi:hypothetical protein